jgi:hypothetical protein
LPHPDLPKILTDAIPLTGQLLPVHRSDSLCNTPPELRVPIFANSCFGDHLGWNADPSGRLSVANHRLVTKSPMCGNKNRIAWRMKFAAPRLLSLNRFLMFSRATLNVCEVQVCTGRAIAKEL